MRAALLLPWLLAGCAADPGPKEESATPILITRADQLDAAVGALVTLQGPFVSSKIPTLLGVDVDGQALDAGVAAATATGILRKTVVTKAQLEEELRRAGGPSANRGPGTFYHLVDPATNRLAEARPRP